MAKVTVNTVIVVGFIILILVIFSGVLFLDTMINNTENTYSVVNNSKIDIGEVAVKLCENKQAFGNLKPADAINFKYRLNEYEDKRCPFEVCYIFEQKNYCSECGYLDYNEEHYPGRWDVKFIDRDDGKIMLKCEDLMPKSKEK